MRRGRITFLAAALTAAAATIAGAPGALAATPQDICKDLQDGKIDGTYTAGEWTAFFQDSTVQGYCSPIVVVTPPPPPVTTTTVTPPPPPPPPVTTTETVTPPPPPPVTTTVTPPPPVPLTPTPPVTSGVAGEQQTVSAPKTSSVKGAQHTVTTPVKQAGAAPLGAAKRTGTLPFTGAQLVVFLLVGLGLVTSGLVLRATGRRRGDPA